MGFYNREKWTAFLDRHSLPNRGSVGDGWIPILDELVTALKAAGWDGDLHQVKEKFGGLRFYIGPGNDEIWKLIQAAEDKSFETCEDCGAPGKTRDRAWLRTLCDACDAAKPARR